MTMISKYIHYCIVACLMLLGLGCAFPDMAMATGGLDFGSSFDQVRGVSYNGQIGSDGYNIEGTGTADQDVKRLALAFLRITKIVVSGVILIFIVFIGMNMVFAMGSEEDLANAKRQLWYSMYAFLFINIPGQLYGIVGIKETGTDVSGQVGSNFTDS